jgi:hypothetical protein
MLGDAREKRSAFTASRSLKLERLVLKCKVRQRKDRPVVFEISLESISGKRKILPSPGCREEVQMSKNRRGFAIIA